MNAIHKYASQFRWIIPMKKMFISNDMRIDFIKLVSGTYRILVIFDFFGIFWELTPTKYFIKSNKSKILEHGLNVTMPLEETYLH